MKKLLTELIITLIATIGVGIATFGSFVLGAKLIGLGDAMTIKQLIDCYFNKGVEK